MQIFIAFAALFTLTKKHNIFCFPKYGNFRATVAKMPCSNLWWGEGDEWQKTSYLFVFPEDISRFPTALQILEKNEDSFVQWNTCSWLKIVEEKSRCSKEQRRKIQVALNPGFPKQRRKKGGEKLSSWIIQNEIKGRGNEGQGENNIGAQIRPLNRSELSTDVWKKRRK